MSTSSRFSSEFFNESTSELAKLRFLKTSSVVSEEIDWMLWMKLSINKVILL